MLKIIFSLIVISTLIGCEGNKQTSQDILTNGFVASHYDKATATLDLSNKNLSGFITLKGKLEGSIVNTIDLSGNSIQDVDLRALDTAVWIDLSDNQLRFGSDILLPPTVRHLDLSKNQLETLDTLDNYQKIQTINVSNNPLDDDSLWFVGELSKLKYANIDDTLVGSGFIEKFEAFNAGYLLNNEPVY